MARSKQPLVRKTKPRKPATSPRIRAARDVQEIQEARLRDLRKRYAALSSSEVYGALGWILGRLTGGSAGTDILIIEHLIGEAESR